MLKHEQKHFTFQSTSQRGVATARAVPKSMMRFRRTSTSLLYYINLTDFTTAELDETASYRYIYYALCPCIACLCPCSACSSTIVAVAHGLFCNRWKSTCRVIAQRGSQTKAMQGLDEQ